ncbi:MAG TPA: threonine--tRNA ligase [Patescibacteria group bacterium]|nr:threonine--tRNA ligase [Patescibacteria group bacterium]
MENKKKYLDYLRHSCAHLLAAAVLELFPDTKHAIGPAIENGFYYDFDFTAPLSEKDLLVIEKKMREIVSSWNDFTRHEVNEEQAKKEFSHNPYKQELINEFSRENKTLTLYQSGNYKDLCRGGHIDSPKKELQYFKLLSIAGAYWRGDEKNKMLTRIYGTCFPTKKELDDHLWQIEEAKKRDHRKLGKELDLFIFSDLVGKGLPLFTPKGTIVRELLNDFSQKLRLDQGFQKVWTPHITKSDLYKTSGHWDKFGDELFLVQSQETHEQLVMKPMNCPHHQQIYASKSRSYKDLPIKYLETTTIYRDEKAGEMIGLSRVRSVTQDDSHIFCAPNQINTIYTMLITIVKTFYDALKMKYRARLSFRDETNVKQYLGDETLWKKAQTTLLDIAKHNTLDYFVAVGEAAFYGPKIDFMVEDALGRSWQLATPQLDFVQPQRFGLKYVDTDGKEQTPVMIHFALMGSLERFLSIYIEHIGGAFPLWLSPLQVAVLPVSSKFHEYAHTIYTQLIDHGIRTSLNADNKTLGARIRDETLQKIPFMIIIGEKEIQSQKSKIKSSKNMFISVRTREGENRGTTTLYEFVHTLKEYIDKKL